jgi:hypothetical protein
MHQVGFIYMLNRGAFEECNYIPGFTKFYKFHDYLPQY